MEKFNDEKPTPIRCLIFKQLINGEKEGLPDQKVIFPEGHTSVLFKGKLYGWYGREVKIDEDIKCVIEPIGSGISGNEPYETYIVERKDGRYAIAELSIPSSNRLQNITTEDHIKSELTGGIMEFGQELTCRRSWSFGGRVKTPLRMTCFKNFNYSGGEFLILLDVKDEIFDKKAPSIVFYPTTESYIGNIGHFIFKDRETSLESHMNNPVEYANFLHGELEFFNNGNKATAISPKGYRISTDAECLKKANRNMTIVWYLDPTERGENDD